MRPRHLSSSVSVSMRKMGLYLFVVHLCDSGSTTVCCVLLFYSMGGLH